MQTGLAATFFTLILFTTIGFMIRSPLKNGGGKAVILQYLTLGLMLVLVQSVPGKGALVSAELTPVWWPVLLAVFAVGFVAAPIAAAPGRRKDVTAKTAVCILLILFCVGVSYIASASVSMLTGVTIPWFAASLFIAALLRNTTEEAEEEFPEAQSETICQLSLILSAATLVIPV